MGAPGMKKPFRLDPATTGAFTALKDGGASAGTLEEVSAAVIGGGTGAPISIQTLLSMGIRTSAVVAMTDDGGSTGILREQADVTPPGDIRKCLAAFAADPRDPLTRAFRYRFEFAQQHTLGNLMLSALEDATGSFIEAIEICESLLHARGHVYPSTLDRVTLLARTREGEYIQGQMNASNAPRALERVWLDPAHPCSPYRPALEAIRDADLIVLGPGSLFTSIIPNLLVPGIIDAIRASRGKTVFVCSLADMQGETWGMRALEHVDAVCRHGMEGLLDYVFIHARSSSPQAHARHGRADRHDTMRSGKAAGAIPPVHASQADIAQLHDRGIGVVVDDFYDPQYPTWHDPRTLRSAFAKVLKRCRLPQM